MQVNTMGPRSRHTTQEGYAVFSLESNILCGESENHSQNNRKGPCEDAGGNRYKVSVSTVKRVLYRHHWSSPKPTPLLAAFPSSSLLPMTGKNCKICWSWRIIFPSLTLNISYLSSLPIAAAVHSTSVKSPSNLPTSSPYCFYLLFGSFAHQYFY